LLRFRFAARLPPFDSHRYNRDQNNGNDHKFKILLNKWNIAKEKSGECEEQHPGNTTHKIIGNEIPIGHFPNARNERRKRANDRDKTRQENGFATMLFKEGMGLIEIFLLQPFDIVGAITKVVTNGIIHG